MTTGELLNSIILTNYVIIGMYTKLTVYNSYKTVRVENLKSRLT